MPKCTKDGRNLGRGHFHVGEAECPRPDVVPEDGVSAPCVHFRTYVAGTCKCEHGFALRAPPDLLRHTEKSPTARTRATWNQFWYL